MSRPPLHEIQKVDVAESYDRGEWVEIVMEVNRNGQAAEPFMVEWFPDESALVGNQTLKEYNTRVINPDVFDEEKQREYQLFAAIVGRLTLHD